MLNQALINHHKFSNIATMKTLDSIAAFAMLILALGVYAQAPKPPDAAPPLSASQQIALKGIDDDEKNLQVQYQTDEGKRAAVAAEYTQQHPGWTIGRNNEPSKIPTPTPPVEPKK